MTEEAEQTTPRPILTSIAAQLFVADIQASCDFFTNKLGFAVDFIYGDPSFYAQVTRDNARLTLRHVDEPVFAGDIREREALLSASITVASASEIDQLSLSYQAAGVNFHQTIRKEPWGATTFVVADIDGNLILFAGPLGEASPLRITGHGTKRALATPKDSQNGGMHLWLGEHFPRPHEQTLACGKRHSTDGSREISLKKATARIPRTEYL